MYYFWGRLVMNTWKSFYYLFHVWKIFLLLIKFWIDLFFQHFEGTVFSFALYPIKKSVVILIIVPQFLMCLFLPAAYKVFTLSWFYAIWLWCALMFSFSFLFLVLELYWSFSICGFIIFTEIWKFLAFVSLKIFCPPPFQELQLNIIC